MRHLSSLGFTVFVTTLVAGLGACSNSPTAPSAPVAFTLAPGQSRAVGGLSIRFVAVTRDNRCPGDALCIVQGDANVALETFLDGRRSVLELQVNDPGARSTTIGDYRVELTEVMPYPFLSLPPIEPSEYRASFKISAAN